MQINSRDGKEYSAISLETNRFKIIRMNPEDEHRSPIGVVVNGCSNMEWAERLAREASEESGIPHYIAEVKSYFEYETKPAWKQHAIPANDETVS